MNARPKPTVSVIIPTYNRAHLLPRAVGSVLAQTFTDYELIIVDDASTDNTREVVESFRDPRIRYLSQEQNRGGSAARNVGIKAAQGEYIAFLDSDDEWLPQYLQKQIQKISGTGPRIGAVYTGDTQVDSKGRTLSTRVNRFKGDIRNVLLQGCVFATCQIMVKRDCFTQVGLFDENLRSCQDWDMWIRLSQKFHFDFIPEVLGIILLHGSQISNSLSGRIQSLEILLNKYNNKFTNKDKANIYKRLAGYHIISDNKIKGRVYFLKSIIYNPLQKSSYLHLIFSLILFRTHKKLFKQRSVQIVNGVNYYY